MRERSFAYLWAPAGDADVRRLCTVVLEEVRRRNRTNVCRFHEKSLERRAASIAAIDSDPGSLAELSGLLGVDQRFRVHALNDVAAALENIQAWRHEACIVTVDHDPVRSYELIRQIKLEYKDVVIVAADHRPCVQRAANARRAGAGQHIVLPPTHAAFHLMATEIFMARSEPTRFGRHPVLVRLDTGVLYVDGYARDLRESGPAWPMLTTLCREYGWPVSIERLAIACYGENSKLTRERIRTAVNRLHEWLGPYADRLFREGKNALRLVLDTEWLDCCCPLRS